MIKRGNIATVAVTVGVLGNINAAGAHTALPESAMSKSLSTMARAPSAQQEFSGPIGRLNLTPASPQPALNMADGDDNGDDNGYKRHKRSHHGDDDGDDDGD